MSNINLQIRKEKPRKVIIELDRKIMDLVTTDKRSRYSLENLTTSQIKEFFKKFEHVVNYQERENLIEIEMSWEVREISQLISLLQKKFEETQAYEIVVNTQSLTLIDQEQAENILSSREVKLLYDYLNKGGSESKDKVVKVTKGIDLKMVSWRFKELINIKITRHFDNLDYLRINLPTELINKSDNTQAGLIVVNSQTDIEMEASIPIIKSLNHGKAINNLVACTDVNKLLNPANVISINLNNEYELLKSSYLKYVIIPEVEDRETLMKAMGLVSAGKYVLIGVDTISTHGGLQTLNTIVNYNQSELEGILYNTLGFVNPKLNVRGNQLRLDHSEIVSLSDFRIRKLFESRLSNDTFNSFIEKSSLPLNLRNVDLNDVMSTREELDRMFKVLRELKGSDVHLVPGAKPMFRIKGELVPKYSDVIMTSEMLNQIKDHIVSDEIARNTLETENRLPTSYVVSGVGRYRIHIFKQRGSYGLVARVTDTSIPSFEALRLPKILTDAILNSRSGIVIFTGPTGSGKSTSTAAILSKLSQIRSNAITSLADPIEYIHNHGKGIFSQREIPYDSRSFDEGLYDSFRMDPDIIELAEMRTVDAMDSALRLANSGHLVMSTLHNDSVIDSLKTFADKLPGESTLQILSKQIVAIVTQKLLKGNIDGREERFPVIEYLIPTGVERNMIAKADYTGLASNMKTNAHGNKSIATWMDYELKEAFERGWIDEQTLIEHLKEKPRKGV